METLLYNQSEKENFHLPWYLYARHLGFYKIAAVKKACQYLSF